METTASYNDKVVRQFTIMTVVWGIVGMLVGVIIAAQLLWPALNFEIPWLTYGRLRPLHTNAVIFAFGGSALFATSYYVVQRTCGVRLLSDKAAAFTFWGWLPCGLVYAMALAAAGTGSAINGAGFMLAFGIGTVPAMALIGIAGGRLARFFGHQGFRRVAGLAVLALGIWTAVFPLRALARMWL